MSNHPRTPASGRGHKAGGPGQRRPAETAPQQQAGPTASPPSSSSPPPAPPEGSPAKQAGARAPAGAAATTAREASSAPARRDLRFALTWLLAYLALALATRTANCLTLIAAFESYPYRPLGPPFSLPFLLGEEALVGAALAALLVLLHRWRAGVVLARILGALTLLGIAVEQLAFKFFFGHLDPSLLAEGSRNLAAFGSSVRASLDLPFFVVLAVAVAGSLALLRPAGLPPLPRVVTALLRRPRALVAGWAALVVATFALGALEDQHDLQHSLAGDLLRGAVRSSVEVALPTGTQQQWRLDHPLHGTPAPAEELSARLRLGPPAAGRPLNLVLFVFESCPWRETSLRPGHQHDTTPFIRQLGERSLVFENYYTVFPGSTRSNWAMLTGWYPTATSDSQLQRYARTGLPTLADLLHQRGYRTAFYSSSDSRFDGFDLFLLDHPYDSYLDLNNLTDDQKRGRFMTTWGIEEAPVVDLALDWARQQRAQGKPFFLQYNATFPHHPYDVPTGNEAALAQDWDPQKKQYQASLYYADQMVQRLYDGLQKLGLLEQTLFVVVPDHGEAFGDVHPKNRLHMDRVYEENVHTWLVASNAQRIPGAVRSHRLGSQLDFTPTMLELLGQQPADPAAVPFGQSLVGAGYSQRPVYLGSRTGELGMVDGQYKAIWSTKEGRGALYDLATDPDEQQDLAASRSDWLTDYRAALGSWQAGVADLHRRLLQGHDARRLVDSLRGESRRRLQFGVREDPVLDAVVCPEAQAATCQPGPTPVFDGRAPLVVKLFWRRPGTYSGPVIWYAPKGGKAQNRRELFRDVQASSTVRLDSELPLRRGRWKVQVMIDGNSRPVRFRIDRPRTRG